MSHKFQERGFSFVETLVGVAILTIVVFGLYGVFQLSMKVISQSKSRVTATALANQKIEIFRNLSYNQVGTINGIPSGDIPETETFTINGVNYTVKTTVGYVDDSFDGVAPADALPNDYKKVKIEVSWSGFLSGKSFLITDISPKGLEAANGSGNLLISVFDALGVVIPQADIHIVNTAVNPSIDVNYQTNNDGQYLVAGAPTSTAAYEISATKVGYSVDRTYGPAEVANPAKPHITVLEGQLTQVSFSIDLLSSFSIDTVSILRKDYYVRKSGDDTNDGLSAATAFLTIGKAALVAQAGDSIYVGAGVYNETVIPAKSGAAGLPIAYIADTGGLATGDAGAIVLDGNNTLCYAFDLSLGRNYLIIDGFEATQYRQCDTSDATFYFTGNSNNNIYRNLVAYNTKRDGIAFGASNNLLENCLVHDTGDDSFTLGRSLAIPSGNTVRNCTFTGQIGIDTGGGGHAIEFGETDGTNVFENNIINHSISGNNWQNNTFDYNDWTQGVLAGIGNVSIDPLFVDENIKDFHLSQIASGQFLDSPVIDLGSDVAVNLGLDAQTTRTDEASDIGQVDLGYHYITTHPLAPPAPQTIAIPNVAFSLRGNKVIGTDASNDPVYKYLVNLTTNASGHLDIPNLEWDSYNFTIDPLEDLDLIRTEPVSNPLGQNISLLPNINQPVNLFLEAENSLLVETRNASTTDPVFNAQVRLLNIGLGFDQTQLTDVNGQTLFIPLNAVIYQMEIEIGGYQDYNGNINVSGDNTVIINLTPTEN